MLRQAAVVKSGDEAKVRTLAPFFINDFLRIIEAAAALNFTTKAGVSLLGRRSARMYGFAHFTFRNAVAYTNDHARAYKR